MDSGSIVAIVAIGASLLTVFYTQHQETKRIYNKEIVSRKVDALSLLYKSMAKCWFEAMPAPTLPAEEAFKFVIDNEKDKPGTAKTFISGCDEYYNEFLQYSSYVKIFIDHDLEEDLNNFSNAFFSLRSALTYIDLDEAEIILKYKFREKGKIIPDIEAAYRKLESIWGDPYVKADKAFNVAATSLRDELGIEIGKLSLWRRLVKRITREAQDI